MLLLLMVLLLVLVLVLLACERIVGCVGRGSCTSRRGTSAVAAQLLLSLVLLLLV